VITDLEAKILNDINKKHYGMDSQLFAGKDYIVLLEEFFSMFSFLDKCYSKLVSNNASKYKHKCGFSYVDSVCVVPYCAVGDQKYLPLFCFEGDTDTLIERTVNFIDLNLAYLKFCCNVLGVRDELFDKDILAVVDFDHVKNSLPPETDFNYLWPSMLTDSFLITCKKSMHQNPPGSWFKVLPEVVNEHFNSTSNTTEHGIDDEPNGMTCFVLNLLNRYNTLLL